MQDTVLVVHPYASAWRVLGMMPSLRKSATLEQTDTWRKGHRLQLHHAGLAHLVEMVNKFASEDKHVLCADGQVRVSTYLVCTQFVPSLYQYVYIT